MDKKIILFKLIAFICLSISFNVKLKAQPQNNNTLIKIRGYYVTIFSKSDIVFSYEQNLKKINGESFSTPIDYRSMTFFVPVQLGDSIVLEDKKIKDRFLNYKQQDSIFLIPKNNHDQLFINKIFDKKINLSRQICLLANSQILSPYYKIVENEAPLFKCTYIEGFVVYKNIQDLNKADRDYLTSTYLLKEKCNLKLYYTFYNPYLEIYGLEKWLPYLN